MLADRRLAVSVLVDARSYADAATKAATPLQSADDLHGGRLLAYFPDEELSDGAAEADSKGFFDVYNTPPWDAWVALIGDDHEARGPHLVSWVPPLFLDLASEGIRVNPEECIIWLEDADVPLRDQLRERGVIA
jgi:acyl-CoA-binding protein